MSTEATTQNTTAGQSNVRINHVTERALVCPVCQSLYFNRGEDKDGITVLVCDQCEAEYHDTIELAPYEVEDYFERV